MTLEQRAEQEGLVYVAVQRELLKEVWPIGEWQGPVQFRFTGPDASGDPLLIGLEMKRT